MDKYTLSIVDSLKANNEIDNALDSNSENLLPNKVVTEAINNISDLVDDLERHKQPMLSDEQKQILEYIIPGDLRSKIGAARGMAPSLNVTKPVFFAESVSGRVGGPYTDLTMPAIPEFMGYAPSSTEGRVPQSEAIVLTRHITNDTIEYSTGPEKSNGTNHLVGIKIRMRFVKKGMYALKVFTQPGEKRPRILRAISKWMELSENNDWFGQEYTFEFEEPIIASSLRNPGANDRDSIGLQVAWQRTGDNVPYGYQSSDIPELEENETAEEAAHRIKEAAKNLLPQVAYYIVDKYATADGTPITTIDEHGCWYYDWRTEYYRKWADSRYRCNILICIFI